jgi:hypothetical protein
MEININDKVRVKLTCQGREALKNRHREFWAEVGMPNEPYTPPAEDAEGWSEWQLWCLMQELGPHCQMGVSPPFETTIQLIVREKTPN